MNTHKNARLTFARRLEMVQDITQRGLSHAAAAAAQSVSAPTVRKWLGRYLAHGKTALRDRSSRPQLSPRAIAPAKALAIVELRRHRLTQGRIAVSLGVSKSTVGRVLARAGLSHLKDLEPMVPVMRYKHEAAGDLLRCHGVLHLVSTAAFAIGMDGGCARPRCKTLREACFICEIVLIIPRDRFHTSG